jgi:ribonuclease BN (tRNA processing enzyme)
MKMGLNGRMRLAFLFTLVLALAPLAATQPATQKGTQVILLGTGNPNPDPQRSGPATAIVVDGEVYLVDSGPGIVRRASAAGLAMPAVKRVFITHLHSDHTLGLPDLIFSPWTMRRTSALEAYGPPGLAAMVKGIHAAYAEDIRMRLDGLEPANTTGYKVNAHEIKPGVIYRDAKVTVKAFAVPHGSWKHAYGYRFETPDRVIVISGDTTRSTEIIEQARNADILIHEVYSDAAWAKRPPEWQKYHAAFHTSAGDLGRIAAEAKPKVLVLYHVLMWGDPEEQLLREIRAGGFTGRVVIGNDLDVF